MQVEEQVVVIYAGVNGYLDPLPVKDVSRFEAELLRYVRTEHPDILKSIRDAKEITKETGDTAEGGGRQICEGLRMIIRWWAEPWPR